MPSDAYIKFGEGTDPSPNDSKVLLPLIEGDSTDEKHYWWCELRGYDFSLEAGERNSGSEGDNDKEKPKPSFKKVTIKKRVDWASTELFMRCCYAAQAVTKKADAEKDDVAGIDQVTIEICKQSNEKFPFVIVKYFGVRIVGYSIAMDGPEPAETISFVFERLDVEYQPTDPYTGGIKGNRSKALSMKNYAPANAAAGRTNAPAVTPSGATSTSTSAVTAPAAVSGNGGGNSGNGSPANNGSGGSEVSSTEAAANANFPGLWPGTGFGILPD